MTNEGIRVKEQKKSFIRVTMAMVLIVGVKVFFLNRLFLTRWLPKRSQIQDSNESTDRIDVEKAGMVAQS